jgi:hypothetical protein
MYGVNFLCHNSIFIKRYKYIFFCHKQYIRGRDRMVVGSTTTYAIIAYHHWCCEFESRSGRGVQHYVIKVCQWLATGRWFSPGPPVSSTNKTDRHDITELLLKVALNTIKQTFFVITVHLCKHSNIIHIRCYNEIELHSFI